MTHLPLQPILLEVKENMEAAYQQMAQEEESESEALTWVEAVVGDVTQWACLSPEPEDYGQS